MSHGDCRLVVVDFVDLESGANAVGTDKLRHTLVRCFLHNEDRHLLRHIVQSFADGFLQVILVVHTSEIRIVGPIILSQDISFRFFLEHVSLLH